ncbi:WSC domain-containing protein 1-like [Pollicipes pollicipes]|uniref:WSC domain-containing protein 1-like n=1 Tax=Pollicipes pollicipes TaxID=41117 RepID=UPI001884D491|nr:WSC domain-containing protein 1-like [Pollicipes pollicipes]
MNWSVGGMAHWQRWDTFRRARRWQLANHGCGVLVVCVTTALFLLGLVASLSDKGSVLFLTSGRPASRLQSAAVEDNANDIHGKLVLPLRKLVEPALPSRSWFSNDASCARFTTHFARSGSLPAARLASFFRSGNTWSRYLLEAATGFFTCGATWEGEMLNSPPTGRLSSIVELRSQLANSSGAAGASPELRDSGFAGEALSPMSRACLVGKTHAFAPHWRSDGSTAADDGGERYPLPAVLLVRDPFRALISLRHYHERSSGLVARSRATDAAFAGGNWTRFVERYSQFWFELAEDWATGPRDTLLVAYERLEANPAHELDRMLRFLGVTPSLERLRCVLKHVEGGFHNRDHPIVPDDKVYTRPMMEAVWWRILELNKLLTARGYRRLPVEKYAFFYDV